MWVSYIQIYRELEGGGGLCTPNIVLKLQLTFRRQWASSESITLYINKKISGNIQENNVNLDFSLHIYGRYVYDNTVEVFSGGEDDIIITIIDAKPSLDRFLLSRRPPSNSRSGHIPLGEALQRQSSQCTGSYPCYLPRKGLSPKGLFSISGSPRKIRAMYFRARLIASLNAWVADTAI